MRTPRLFRLSALVLPAVVLVLIFGTQRATLAQSDENQAGPLPPGPGVNLVYAKCQQCHPIRQVAESAGLPPFLWEDTIDLMKQLGLQVTAEEEAILLEYFVTYMGPDGPPEGSAEAAPAEAPAVDGASVYASSCSACHGAEGAGVPNAFPPLVDHAPALFAADRSYLPEVLVHGLQGQITVDGVLYNGVMPSWAQLSDDEIAAVLNHVLTSWGNDVGPDAELYSPGDIENARNDEMSGAIVYERRPDPGDSGD